MTSREHILEMGTTSLDQVGVIGLLSGAGMQSTAVAAVAILALFVAIVGGYYFWRRRQARRKRQKLSTAIEAQASLAPKSLSDPNQRAALDKLRQKFEAGLQEFQSRGKDIFKLPWYLIIGEPGSGKTEAIRHSGIEFPTGLQNELQGSGGTVNMDWWFTNHGVILDTAGRLVFNESPAGQSPEWSEFLRLLKEARYHCPINGLFIVLSIESLIKDSAEQIAQKARRLAQQLDLIQRTLDVRFPVYLLVSKSDLLAGFREFFDNIDDPLLQHQMFGWSNPDPLDASFRPEQIGQHLETIVRGLRRRRLALLRESAERQLHREGSAAAVTEPSTTGSSVLRQADQVEALFALPESILRLAPRLHRYVETLFAAGEWSAKPVFLRGIYFTSSMTEGRTLDEAIAFATGLALEQLPEENRSTSSRAYFLRDLFLDKVFKEPGLVTRASNTVKLLRARRLAVLSAWTTAAVLFLAFAGFGYTRLKRAVLEEKDYWGVAAKCSREGKWSPPIIAADEDRSGVYSYRGSDLVPTSGQPSLVQYHTRLKELVQQDLAGGWIFKPISWVVPGGVGARPVAQRIVFENWVLVPIVQQVRTKMARVSPAPADPSSLARQKDALLALLQLEGDEQIGDFLAPAKAPEKYWHAFLSYLTEKDFHAGSELAEILGWTYSSAGKHRNAGRWPPIQLAGGETLSANQALDHGLVSFCAANLQVQEAILRQLGSLNAWVDKLHAYEQAEQSWLADAADPCLSLRQGLLSAKFTLDDAWAPLRTVTNSRAAAPATLSLRYLTLASAASNASPAAILELDQTILGRLAESSKANSLFQQIQERLGQFQFNGARQVQDSLYAHQAWLPDLERNQLAPVEGKPAWEARWNLYGQACLLASTNLTVSARDVGQAWRLLEPWTNQVTRFRTDLAKYAGPLREQVNSACDRITLSADRTVKHGLAEAYVQVIMARQGDLANGIKDAQELTGRRDWFARVEHDLGTAAALGDQAALLQPLESIVADGERQTLAQVAAYCRAQVGFPVIASAARSMNAQGLASAQDLVARLSSELTHALWSTRPRVAEELTQLQRELKRQSTILDCLTDKDQRVAQVQITAVPYEKLVPQDRNAVGVFRWVQLAQGTGTSSEDLTRPAGPLVTQTLDQPLTVSFRTDPSAPPLRQEKLEPWWLLRAIRDGKAEPVGDGSSWRIRIPLADPGRKVDGHAVFEARLLSQTRFPAREDWLR